jgi:tagatose-6-phosphate ketose/aldose isomerase
VNALSALLNLPETERTARGLAHTPAEIAQQPDTWLATFELFKKKSEEIRGFLAAAGLRNNLTSRPSIVLVGAGTSDYVGQSIAYLLRKTWECEVAAVPSTDLLTHFDELVRPRQKYLWVSFSRSGDSPEGVAVLQDAWRKRPDIHHLVVSCNANGQMVLDSAGNPQVLSICLDDTVNDRGLAMTSSFSNMVVFGQCLAYWDDPGRYEQVLMQLVQAGKTLLQRAADCAAALAREPYSKACFVGSGPLRAVARESALKLLELTAGKILTMSESALGLRHGPMAALDRDTLFVCFLSDNRKVQEYERDLLEEIGNKRLVRSRVVVAGSIVPELESFTEHYIVPARPFPAAADYRPPLDVIFGQLLGLFFSLRCNLRPDCPSPSGAISRVVQNVTIHPGRDVARRRKVPARGIFE